LITPILKPKIVAEEHKPREPFKQKIIHNQTPIVPVATNEWDEFCYQDEYNPAIPNEYEKIVKERREKSKEERKRRSPQSGFGKRRHSSDDEDSSFKPLVGSSRIGTAIAPPKSLQESNSVDSPSSLTVTPNFGSAVACRIMAKYGFKDGQGLGKQEQGISKALQVEKTSKRGGRIINEKEIPFAAIPPPPQQQQQQQQQPIPESNDDSSSNEASITEMMKNPSKIILLRNMVGPGEVDDELEPEVKDECTTKYGEVATVHIIEMPNRIPEETVRIFVEFRRIEHAIKALVDLNGRFFGGRQVRCCFYEAEKYYNFIFDA
jgi:splicing factor 45